ncbi:MAG: tetraacyldisaccharide 4'-kinase [Rhodospirillaceae bacterium]|nr:tetraacyldisaccharide 4'-kinase [Rhodospirillaceae bacterium]MBT4463770.1 tetraacyldisaccharide 4'-kinase [Rhodospirillaceae bacterium]MBT5309931.1 tetraacyldisaccharide 4'-kinase [Rhodospirillaceae bacterium]MBT7356388.1 tetraacyldisaccharide 4'-kinase [Rhodospirillaceae bacterium]
MQAPDFWQYGRGGLGAMMLAPVGWLYGNIAKSRMSAAVPWQAPVKVICVGNLVAGGAGKTPVAISIAQRLMDRNATPHFLSRGYGGTLTGPLKVDTEEHRATDVGDEPLLLAHLCPTWIAANRQAGCQAAIEAGANVVVMDDGYQNPGLAKDLSLVVFDGGFGFGNGRVMPAGPLREPTAFGLGRADAVVIVGDDTTQITEGLNTAGYTGPILNARIEPTGTASDLSHELSGQPVVGFAGIGRPDKFLSTLQEIGCDVRNFHAFADHHPYSHAEITRILNEAETTGARVVTTEKDMVRLPDDIGDKVTVVGIDIVWDDAAALNDLLDEVSNA